MSISWFMRVLNESIARQANQEDNCTGRFWEGRFKSQALLDEKALAACMVYVDLNPIRACITKTPEHSDYTSIKKRSEQAQHVSSPNHPRQQVTSLFPFAGNPREHMPEGLPFKLTDYLMLVDETARIQREEKRGVMDANQDRILKRLNIDGERWIEITGSFEDQFSHFVGAESVMISTVRNLGYTRTPDRSHSAYYFN